MEKEINEEFDRIRKNASDLFHNDKSMSNRLAAQVDKMEEEYDPELEIKILHKRIGRLNAERSCLEYRSVSKTQKCDVCKNTFYTSRDGLDTGESLCHNCIGESKYDYSKHMESCPVCKKGKLIIEKIVEKEFEDLTNIESDYEGRYIRCDSCGTSSGRFSRSKAGPSLMRRWLNTHCCVTVFTKEEFEKHKKKCLEEIKKGERSQ